MHEVRRLLEDIRCPSLEHLRIELLLPRSEPPSWSRLLSQGDLLRSCVELEKVLLVLGVHRVTMSVSCLQRMDGFPDLKSALCRNFQHLYEQGKLVVETQISKAKPSTYR